MMLQGCPPSSEPVLAFTTVPTRWLFMEMTFSTCQKRALRGHVV